MIKVEQQHIDCAVEWVNLHYPHLEGVEYNEKVSQAAQEIAELDVQADEAQKRFFAVEKLRK